MTIRLLPHQTRYDLDDWEIRVNGTVAGWVRHVRLRGARSEFYEAHGTRDGKLYRLELSPDREERINIVIRFALAPWKATEVIKR